MEEKNNELKYPVIECREAHIGFWPVGFPLIFSIPFLFLGAMLFFMFYVKERNDNLLVFIACGAFALIGIASLVVGLIPVIRYIILKSKGEEMDATVYDYMDDNILLNNHPSQIVRLIVNTNEGKKVINYQLGNVYKPYEKDEQLKLLMYKNLFVILNKR